MNRCSGITLSGNRCRNPAERKYCHCHMNFRSPSQSCKKKLQAKIKINIDEYRKGRWKSPKQAVAVSYSQVSRKYPECVFKSNKRK